MNGDVSFRIPAALAVVAIVLMGCSPLSGGQTASTEPAATQASEAQATPTPTSTLTPTAVPSEAADINPPAGVLEPGRTYHASRGSVAFMFAVPSGWQFHDSFAFRGHPESPEHTEIWIYTTDWMYGGPDHLPMTPAVFDDPCVHDNFGSFEASLAGQAEAFASIPRIELVSGPAEVTVGGRAGRVATIGIPAADLGCRTSEFWLMFNAGCGAPTLDCSNYPNWTGEAIREWFVDVDGQILNIRAQIRYPDEASSDLDVEIQQIVDSIQFE
jgi:hypothetical protein